MDNLNDKIKKKYYLKYVKYKTKYNNLLNKLKQQQIRKQQLKCLNCTKIQHFKILTGC